MFDNIIGQDKALGLLKSALDSGKNAHAYLFTGPDGVGKATTALRFAAVLECPTRGCGDCPECRQVLSGTHPDVTIVKPDGAVLKIRQIREVGRTIGFKPFQGLRKIYIIEDVNMMNDESANALLKNLEEPPDFVVFVLTAPGADGLLPTIVSRCQEIAFASIKPALIEDWLISKHRQTREKAGVLAALANGSAGKALRLAGDNGAFDLREFVLGRLPSVRSGDVLEAFLFKDELKPAFKTKEKIKNTAWAGEVIDIITSWYRDILVFKEAGDSSLLTNKDKTDDIEKAATEADRETLVKVLTTLKDAGRAMRTNASQELILEHALLALGET